ncbi:MAG TPA: type II toxin-antitoxin system RelE/ParE family toxin [Caulobacteraceae bacterium]|nr:type II toxin-antitoxin system RelE/ParE family toxin [Caulobacteraceae bacterium]
MRLVWSARALDDRRAIYDYIEAEGPRAAVSVDECIEAAVQLLTVFPQSGRPGRAEGTRELIVTGTPYVAPYQLFDEHVQILRVLHGARIWPGTFDDNAST